jgi:hypothetical protein
LADWLAEHGERPRAQFIRAQVDMARGPQHGARYDRLETRTQDLLWRHYVDWLGPLGGVTEKWQIQWEYERGLLHLRNLRLDQLQSEEMLALAGTETWAWVDGLTLVGKAPRRPRHGRVVLASPLDSRMVIDPKGSALPLRTQGAAAVAVSPLLKGINYLRLHENQMIGPKGAAALAASPTVATLDQLSLDENGIGDAGAKALAASAYLTSLTQLFLGGNAIGPKGATALASSPHLNNLEVLFLHDNAIGDAGAQALAASPHLVHLTRADWSDNGIGDVGAQALASSPTMGKLTYLGLSGNPIGEACATALKKRFGESVRF